MSLRSTIVCQFGKPSGLLGKLAGFIMSHRPSNIERIEWAISLLDLKPADRVLETGFGPGIAIEKMSKIITGGAVLGIDHSELMFKEASRRNKVAIASGKVRLFFGSVSSLPVSVDRVDKVLDINSLQFWDKPVDILKDLKKKMRHGGLIALVHQPRNPGATDADAAKAGEEFSRYLRESGFRNIRIETKVMKPVSTVCVTGVNA